MHGSVYIDDAINWTCSLNDGLAGRWMALPGQQRGMYRGLCGRVDGSIVNAGRIGGQRRGGYGAVSFDGSGDYVEFAATAPFDFPGDFTLAVNFRPRNVAAFQEIVARDTDSNRLWSFGHSLTTGSSLQFFDHAMSVTAILTSTTLSNNVWYQAIVTRIGTAMVLYMDGIQNNTGTASANFSGSSPLNIGRRAYPGFPQYFDGDVDDLMVFNRGLSAAEVAAWRRESLNGSPSSLKWYKRKAYSFIDAGGGGGNRRRRCILGGAA